MTRRDALAGLALGAAMVGPASAYGRQGGKPANDKINLA